MLHTSMQAPADRLAGLLALSAFAGISSSQMVHMARDNPDEDVRHFQSGITSGRSDLLNDDIGLSGCVDIADNHLD